MNMATKQSIFEEKAKAYWKGNKAQKGAILDAVCVVSGLTRKILRRYYGGRTSVARETLIKRGVIILTMQAVLGNFIKILSLSPLIHNNNT